MVVTQKDKESRCQVKDGREKIPRLKWEGILRLGGMHMLMSFVGSVGTLMSGSGLEEVLQSAFGGVAKMLSGHMFPQNVRAIRIVVEDVLGDVLTGLPDDSSMSDLDKILETKSEKSETSKLWIDCLVKPLFIMSTFIRAEREGDWMLHLWSVESMLPYFLQQVT
jgi:hypothetical protein